MPWLAALLLALCVLAPRAAAQTPTADDTMRAYSLVERAVRAWAIPAADAPTQPETPKAVGACVTLKLRGEVVGRGTAWSRAITGPDAFSPAVLTEATKAAMQQAEPRLGAPNDAQRDAALKLIAQDVLISVELAGPLSITDLDTWTDAELTLRPGLDGVAVRIVSAGNAPPGPLHAMFPSQMMLTNMLPHRAMGAMVASALGEGGAAAALDEPKKLRESSGLRMYRFRVGHVVGTEPSPQVLYRGQSLVAPGGVLTRAEIVRMASGLAQHLSSIDVGGGAEGADSWVSRGMALRAMREANLLKIADTLEVDAAVRRLSQAIEAGRAKATSVEDQRWTTIAGILGNTSVDSGRALKVLGLFMEGPDREAVWDRDLPPSKRDLFAFVSASMRRLDPCGVGVGLSIERDKACVLDLLKSTPDDRLVATMPWLGWADMSVTAHTYETIGPVSVDELPAALALRRMRDQCWAHQLQITDAGQDALDMIGGIVFTSGIGKGGGGGGTPYPTWQCVRPLAFIATMLRDPRLTEPQERPREIAHLMQAMRFLRQLQVDESSAWMYPDPKLALGGIRASTWDNSLPVDATSMTLLCVTELLKSLDELAKQQAPPPAQPPTK